jgi:hypothetical protein
MQHKKKIWLSTALASLLFISVAFATDFYKFGYTGAEMETLFDRVTTASGETGIIICDGAGTFSGITTSAGLRGQLSDETGTGAAVFGTSPTLGTPTLTSPVLDGNITGTAFLDEDDMSSDSATSVASQQSIKAHIADGNITMTNKTLTSPVINTGVSGTAILDEDDMASDSDTQLATQQSIKAYIDSSSVTPSNVVSFSNKSFSQAGTVTITDTGSSAARYPLHIVASALNDTGYLNVRFGKNISTAYNHGRIRYYHVTDDSQSNEVRIGAYEGNALRLNGYDNAAFGGTPGGSGSYKLSVYGTGIFTDTLSLSKASGTGLAVTADIDFNAIVGGATKAEINTTCDGNTATAAEITARCDGVPNYSTDDNSGIVTVTSGGVQIATLDLGTVTSGDVFHVEAQLFYTKGGTGGTGNYYINQDSGTATIAFPASAIADGRNDIASAAYNRHFGGMCFVTGSGTLVMQLYGTSGGSDSTIASGAGDIAATFIKKQ